MQYDSVLAELQKANAFELYRLQVAINMLLEDPNRLSMVKQKLKHGMEVEYFDEDQNRLVPAHILEIRKTRVSIQNLQSGKRWNIPVYMLNVDDSPVNITPQQNQVDRLSLMIGDHVGFVNKHGREMCGPVVKLNPKRAKIKTNEGIWAVPYSMLYTIIEGEKVSEVVAQQSLTAPQDDLFSE